MGTLNASFIRGIIFNLTDHSLPDHVDKTCEELKAEAISKLNQLCTRLNVLFSEEVERRNPPKKSQGQWVWTGEIRFPRKGEFFTYRNADPPFILEPCTVDDYIIESKILVWKEGE